MHVVCLIALLSLAPRSAYADTVYQSRTPLFGTMVEITVWGAPPDRAEAAARLVIDDLRALHRTLHPWRTSALTRLNRLLPAGGWVGATPAVLALIERSTDLYRRSDGLFNPAIGALVRLWGFHGDRPGAQPPAPEKIAALVRARPAMTDLEREGARVRSRNPAVQLDFGAIAKGYAVDVGLRRLRAAGIDNAMINAGGDLCVIGRKGKRPWRIGIRHPRRSGLIATVALRSAECVFTSGDYERYFKYKGRRYHHIIDPRTGMPALQGVVSATVIHDNGTEADAAATALLVAGLEGWRALATKMGIRYALLVDEAGRIHLDRSMAERLDFTEKAPPIVWSAAPVRSPGAQSAGGPP